MDRIESKSGTTRRDALKTGGGLALALLGLGAGTRPAIFAQGTPAADPGGVALEGRYAVIRLRNWAAGQDPAAALGLIRDEFVPLLREIPGFAAYVAVADPASPRAAFVGVFADKGGADESNERAAAWLAENGYAFFGGAPDIAEGRVAVVAGDWDAVAAGAPEVPATPVATPAATPGGGQLPGGEYATVRLRKLKPDAVAEDLAALIQDGFVPLIAAIPGFAAYLSITDPDSRDQVSVNVFGDKAGADESTRVAAEWGLQGAAELVQGDPAVAEGVVVIAVVAETA